MSAPASAVVGDVGIAVDLAAGESMDLPLVVSTASCDPELGHRLPPGDYLLAASVQHSNGDVMTLRSPPIPITIGEYAPGRRVLRLVEREPVRRESVDGGADIGIDHLEWVVNVGFGAEQIGLR